MTDHARDLLSHFQQLGIPEDASAWLLDMWHVIQVFDDIADGDPVSRRDLDLTIWKALIAMPANTFYRRFAMELQPVVATAFFKWKASDDAERGGRADARSFVWRSAYYDLVLLVILLCHGPVAAIEKAESVMALYGEDYAKYREEFSNA